MATNIDLTTPGSSTTIGGAIFQDSANVGSGTGQYNTFLALSDNDGNESGFNTDDTPPIDASNGNIDQSKTHTVLLSTVPIFTDPNTGIQYYEFRVDLNESNSNPNGQISLDTFQIYSSASGAIESLATLQAQTLEYDMDAGLDRTLLLSEVSTGSGTDDYAVLVPVSNFAGLDPATTYLYLYVRLGFDAGPDFVAGGGFEEWNIQSAGTITGTKFSDDDGDGIKDAGEGPIAGVTVFIDNDFDTIVDATDNNGILDAGERYTVTDASGNYTFFGVPVGTWRVDEIVPAGYTQSTGDFETVTVTLGGTSVVDPIGNKPDIKTMNIEKNAAVTGGTANATTDVITYTYTLTNTGNTAIGGIVVKDDNGTPGNTSDDFTLTLQSGDADSDSQLDLTETWSYSATKSVTQSMLDAGNDITNIVTATGTGAASDSDDATVDVVQQKSLNIDKNAAVTGGTANATTDVITYTYTLTNTGNAPIAGIVVKDDNGTPGNTSDDFTLTLQSGDADSDSQLDVTETWSYTSTKSVTQAMLDAGNDITNIVTATGTGAASDSDDATVDVVQEKSLNIDKNASVTGGTANATTDVITYTYTLTNTGNTAIGSIVVKDDNGTPGNTSDDFTLTLQSGDADSDSQLDVNETWSYTATKSVTQAMLDAGNDITNIVTATGNGASDSDDATVDVVPQKSLNIDKNASVTGGTANATTDVITYTYTLTNTGNAAIAGIVVKDDNGTPGNTSDDFTLTLQSGDADSDSQLDVNETWSYTSTKSVTQAMLDAGNDITNIVTATGTGAASDSDDATVDVVQEKSLNIDKNASVTGGTANSTSDIITYTYTLTNTGNTAIGSIVVKDDNGTPGNTSDDFTLTLQSGDADSDSQLDVNETWSYTSTKSVTQAMLDAGNDITNIVTANGNGASDSDDATVDVVQQKSLNIDKNASVTGGTANATTDVITYTYTLTNTGNAAIAGIVVKDDNGTPGNTSDDFTLTLQSGDADSDSQLDVNETWSYTSTKSVTQAMLDAGNDITNIVTATGTDAASDSDDATVDVVQEKSLNIDKNASVTGGTANSTSDVITYTYTLTNTGNTAIGGIVVKDDNGTPGNTSDDFTLTLQSGDADSDSQLDVNETWSYTATKSVTQAMLDAGNDITNIVTANGNGASDSDDATVDVVQEKSLNIDKNASVTGGTANATSDVITYTYTLTNTGNTAIGSIVVKDDNGTPGDTSDDFTLTLQSGDADSDSQLDVNETWSYTSTKSVTQAMLDAGNDITNIVTANGNGASDSDDATVDVVQEKSLNINKTASVTGGTANATTDVITYSYTLTNTGNSAIAGIVVTDDNGTPGNTSDDFTLTLQSGDADSDSMLDVTETWNYSATRGVTQAILDAGTDITNIVTATGTGAASDSDDATVDVVQNPAIDIEKSAQSDGHVDVGDVITYTITVTNTGNITLTGIVVTDTIEGGSPVILGVPSAPATDVTIVESDGAPVDDILGVGETWTYTYLYTVQQSDLDTNSKLHWQDNLDLAQQTVNGVRFNPGTDLPATGTGLVQSFVRLQTNTGSEKGYNTDARPYDVGNNAGNVANFNHSLLLADVPVVTIGGVQYWEFHLDLNEKNSGNNQSITLTELKLFAGDSGSLSGFNNTTNNFTSNDPGGSPEQLLYNLDSGGVNRTVDLNDWSTGSGHGDYAVLVPVVTVTDPDNTFVYLYSGFGDTSGGFEEWYITLPDTISNSVSVTTTQGASDSDSTTVGGSTTSEALFAAVEVQNEADATITKSASVPWIDGVGDVIHYTVAVENTGTAGLSGVVVRDAFEGGGAITLTNFNSAKNTFSGDVNHNGVLDIDETWTYDYNYTVKRSDIISNGKGDGHLTNVATLDSVETHPISTSTDVDIFTAAQAQLWLSLHPFV